VVVSLNERDCYSSPKGYLTIQVCTGRPVNKPLARSSANCKAQVQKNVICLLPYEFSGITDCCSHTSTNFSFTTACLACNPRLLNLALVLPQCGLTLGFCVCFGCLFSLTLFGVLTLLLGSCVGASFRLSRFAGKTSGG